MIKNIIYKLFCLAFGHKMEVKGKYDVLFCVDDRKQVTDMWRRNGLICLQCAEGNF